MPAVLVPVHFGSSPDEEFGAQVSTLRVLLRDVAEVLPAVPLGAPIPRADAVLMPQMLGEAYRRLAEFRSLALPIIVLTSEFGTVSMWDWEIDAFLRSGGVTVIAPTSLDQARLVCRALGVRNRLAASRFLVFQDNPGEGFQASIFKRFFWWEQECSRRMFDRFGITVEVRSFRALGERARDISDVDAEATWYAWKDRLNIGQMPQRSLHSALKLYLAVVAEMGDADDIVGVGINCLNESHFSDTTPCLAWNMLYEDRRLIWGCEADTMSMLTKYLVNKVLDVPVMMTNLYPFLMGNAALKHERIPAFPKVKERPNDHVLAAHCGYFGVVPQSFATSWALRKKVLQIVDENATAIDARMQTGPVTLVKLASDLQTLSVVPAVLETYAQFKDSDCLNGAVLRVDDGQRLVDNLDSHHYIVSIGDNGASLRMMASVMGLSIKQL